MSIEAMKQALEALEEFGEHYDWCHQFPTYAFPENFPPCNCGYDKARTDLRQAIKEHAMKEVQRLGQEIEAEPVAWMYESVCGDDFVTRYHPPSYAKNIRPLYTSPVATNDTKRVDETPEKVHEPVAWLEFNERGECRELFTEKMRKAFPNYPTDGMTPVYTSPPQRQPLTESGIKRLWSQALADTEGEHDLPLVDFARAIEQAHGIKEQP